MARRTDVFINCPFSSDYRELMEAIVFTVLASGFRPRSALEAGDSGDVRLDKIVRLIRESAYSIHDLSAVELDCLNQLPRFNMPFELGLAIGLKKGASPPLRHSFLVLERARYTSQKCLSDISGQDAQAHQGESRNVISIVRNWLRTEGRRSVLPGQAIIDREFRSFRNALPAMCDRAGLDRESLPFIEMMALATTWLKQAS